MIIYKDLLDPRQEFFCDETFGYTEEGDFLYKLKTKLIKKPKDDMSSVNIGANPSAEEQEEALDEEGGEEKVLDICWYHKLEENELLSNVKLLKKFLRAYMTAISEKLKEDDPEAWEDYKKKGKEGLNLVNQIISDAGDNLAVYVGENFEFPEEKEGKDGKKSYDVKQGIVLGVWRDDGQSLDLYMLKHGLLKEKV